MKEFYIFFIYLLFLTKTVIADNSILVQSTTSTYNSGFYDYILPIIKKEINITANVVSVGTGAALKNAANCDGDILIVHSKERELDFVRKGFGVKRHNLMYNDFIIVGPKKNPAKINRTDSPVKAFTKIYNTQSFFSSRGDESGTNSKEKAIWNISNLNPQKFSGKWYRETGSGMGATLNLAAGMAAYTLTDRATWINFQNKLDLVRSGESNEILFNQYGITLVNPKRCPNVKVNNSIKFINWLLSKKGQNTIRNFKIKDEYLFYPNAN